MTRIVLAAPFQAMGKRLDDLLARYDTSGEVLYQARNQLRLFTLDGHRLVLKKFGNNWAKKLLSLVKRSKAQKSYRNGVALSLLNFLTPTPIGYVERRSWMGFVREAYYLSAYIPHPPLADCYNDECSFDRTVLAGFARFVARLHEAGILHHDLNASNVRYEWTDGEVRYWLIDINRMRFKGKGGLSKQACFDNLTRFCHNSEMFRFVVREYLRARNWEAGLFEEALARKRRHDARVDLKRKLKKML